MISPSLMKRYTSLCFENPSRVSLLRTLAWELTLNCKIHLTLHIKSVYGELFFCAVSRLLRRFFKGRCGLAPIEFVNYSSKRSTIWSGKVASLPLRRRSSPRRIFLSACHALLGSPLGWLMRSECAPLCTH